MASSSAAQRAWSEHTYVVPRRSSHPQHVIPAPLDDRWRACAALAGDLAARPVCDIEGSLQYLLDRLCELAGASHAFMMILVQDPGRPDLDPMKGWSPARIIHREHRAPAHHEATSAWLEQGSRPSLELLMRAMARSTGANRAYLRRELAADSSWESSSGVDALRRAFGIGDRLMAAYSLTPTVEVIFALDRPCSADEFSLEERDIVLSAICALGFFHRRAVRHFGLIDASQPLTPRERELLSQLLTGCSEKEIASLLGLTTRTCHQYITKIYRKFGVHSRAELLALWLNNAP